MARKRVAISDYRKIPIQPDMVKGVRTVYKYENYLISHMLIKGTSVEQMASSLGVELDEMENIIKSFNRRFTRYIYRFQSRNGEVIEGATTKALVARMRRHHYYIASANNMSFIISNKNGMYSYRGTYIGQFTRIKLVRRLKFDDSKYKQLSKEMA